MLGSILTDMRSSEDHSCFLIEKLTSPLHFVIASSKASLGTAGAVLLIPFVLGDRFPLRPAFVEEKMRLRKRN
ncbi:hypothetical protein BJX68DRAFT_239467 [Aspergillus pseudodeflectus]|uniref:Uncharacterized protein n=1 Tax=Aspergillus pseudodeflectus TaxID=176178 RepID=A0ABR4K6L5_9EURO